MKKSARFDCAAFHTIYQRLREKFWQRASLQGSLTDSCLENDAIVIARGQAKLSWRHRPHAAGCPLLESDLPGSSNLLDCEHRMGAPIGRERRSHNRYSISQKRIPGCDWNLSIYPLVPRAIQLETRPRPGFSRIAPKRMDGTQRKGQLGFRIVGLEGRLPVLS